MRKANTNDLFNIVRLIDHIGLKEEVFKVTKGTDDIERIGFDFIFELLIKATTEEAQKEIYAVLAQPFECEPDQIGLNSFDENVNKFMECFDLKTLANFIKRANLLE